MFFAHRTPIGERSAPGREPGRWEDDGLYHVVKQCRISAGAYTFGQLEALAAQLAVSPLDSGAGSGQVCGVRREFRRRRLVKCPGAVKVSSNIGVAQSQTVILGTNRHFFTPFRLPMIGNRKSTARPSAKPQR